MRLTVEELRNRISAGKVGDVWVDVSQDLCRFRLCFNVLEGEGPKETKGTLRPHHRQASREFSSLQAVWKCAENAGWTGDLKVNRVTSFDD